MKTTTGIICPSSVFTPSERAHCARSEGADGILSAVVLLCCTERGVQVQTIRLAATVQCRRNFGHCQV